MREELVCFDCGDQLDIIRPDPLAEEERIYVEKEPTAAYILFQDVVQREKENPE